MRTVTIPLLFAVIFLAALLIASPSQIHAAQPAGKAAETPQPKDAPAAAPEKAAAPPKAAGANTFNRLMKPKSERNPAQAADGIHDPDNPGTPQLQPPKEAFTNFTNSNAGNYINWVQTLKSNAINPRYDRQDPNAEALILDLDIVREVKGSMPDVVYPHDRHTAWLDCSNCHPDIFIPEKGKNAISMAQILMGQKCGVCHGKVAFPVSECRLCHSKPKTPAAKPK
ncbi:MAG: cytochrome c, class I [Magnetococcales bacterium]|nr:cytochrome c, class I [Magnetococcales bacterium]